MNILAKSIPTYSAFDLDGVQIVQADKDFTIGKHDITQGYVYVTGIAKASGKKVSHFLLLDETKQYIETLSLNAGIPALSLCKALKGGNQLAGTWMHPLLAIEFLGWISPEFRLWGNKILLKILGGEEITSTDRAQGLGIIASFYREEQEEIDNRRLPGDDLYYDRGVN